MRTLIALTILLSCSAVGQGKVYITKETQDTMFVHSLLHLYDQYAKECYADSQRHCGQWMNGGEWYEPCDKNDRMWMDSTFNIPPGSHVWYSHKEPTFPGFIEYLRRKGK